MAALKNVVNVVNIVRAGGAAALAISLFAVAAPGRAQEAGRPASPAAYRLRASLSFPMNVGVSYDLVSYRNDASAVVPFVYGESFFGLINGAGVGVRAGRAGYVGLSAGAYSIIDFSGGFSGDTDVSGTRGAAGARAYFGWQNRRTFAEAGLGVFAVGNGGAVYPHLALGVRF